MSGDHAIVVADLQGLIQHWDATAERYFGFSAAEALGKSRDLIVPPEFQPAHWAGFRKAVATGVCKLDRATTNVPVRCKDGQIRATPARCVFLEGPRGDVIGVAALYSARAGSETAFGEIVPL